MMINPVPKLVPHIRFFFTFFFCFGKAKLFRKSYKGKENISQQGNEVVCLGYRYIIIHL